MYRNRQTIVGRFCTFFYNRKRVADRILEDNIIRKIESHPNKDEAFSEIFWFNHFLQAARDNSDPLAEKHLFAYLEEPCYWSAKYCFLNSKRVDLNFFDYFEIAREVATENWTKIFKNYDPEKSHPRTWAMIILKYQIIDKLRKNGEFKNCSDWRILRCSKKALDKALKAGGIKEQNLAKYLLAWQAFNEIYAVNVQNQRELPPPSQEQWEEITSYFNNFAAPEYSHQKINDVQKILQICSKALRDKNQIRFAHLDDEHPESLELEMTEQWDFNSQNQTESSELSEEMIAVLGSAIASLPKDAKKMLILEHGLIKCTQNYIAQEFNIPQYQVSRLLSRYQRTIVEYFLKYLQKQHNRTIDNEAINTACKQADGWLNWYFQTRIIHQFLQTSLKLNPQINQHIPILRWYFGTNPPIVQKVNKLSEEFKLAQQDLEQKLPQVTEEKVKKTLRKQGKNEEDINKKVTQVKSVLNHYEQTITQELKISETELHAKIELVRITLQNDFQEWLQKTVNISPDDVTIKHSSLLVVDQFLINAPYAEIK